ncbi:MAG: nuclear transport factor 2 family protein [Actinomycetota bacterium]|nr:nuclear transport factor 2 family protein [Actinomycetota bacterium]
MTAAQSELIERFDAAFARRDGAAIAACYAPDVRFRDPVFGELRGDAPGAMWRMLIGRADDLEIRLTAHGVDGGHGNAHWIADYTFTATGRTVHNDVQARFCFGGGLICDHEDRFSFWTWSRQALGPAGLALGWTPLLRARVRRQALAGLAACRRPEQP